MKTGKYYPGLSSFKMIIVLLTFLLSIGSSLGKGSSESRQVDQKRNDAIRRIKAILKQTTYHNESVKSILKITEKATLNFDTYVHIADLAHEFGYHTGELLQIAELTSKVKFETDYFNQIAELSILQAGPGVIELADFISKQDSLNKSEIDSSVQKLKSEAHFKTMDEAMQANKVEMDKINHK